MEQMITTFWHTFNELETYAFGTRSAASEHIVGPPFAFVCLQAFPSEFISKI